MANRSYLYTTNVIPGPDAKAQGRRLIGVSEFRYDIPIVFKLLVSGGTRPCLSSIWNNQEEIALLGDRASGVEKLAAFLSRVADPAAQPLVAEALEFLGRPENQNPYFVLECGEIFDMEDRAVFDQNMELLDQIKRGLQPEVEEALQSLRPPPEEPRPPVGGWWARLLGRGPQPGKPPYDPLPALHALGLGNWSNHLYFSFDNP